jgi:hypothetical protein
MSTLQSGSIITYTSDKGIISRDRVIRVEDNKCVISVFTIGGARMEKFIHVDCVISYINRVITSSANC